jgi:hypothetical protein
MEEAATVHDPPARAMLRDWLQKNERPATWLARQMDVSPEIVRMWLKDSVPTIGNAAKIQAVTGIPVGAWAE